jgi:hypothetical protein
MTLQSSAKWAGDNWVDYAVAELSPVFDLFEELDIPWELLTFESTPLSALILIELPGVWVAGLRIKKDQVLGSCKVYLNRQKYRSSPKTPRDEAANSSFLWSVRSSLSPKVQVETPATAGLQGLAQGEKASAGDR